MPDIVIPYYQPFENNQRFNPFVTKSFRAFEIITANYTGTAPTVTFKLDGVPQGPITGQQTGPGGIYKFWLGGVQGREITDVMFTLVGAATDYATIRYFAVDAVDIRKDR